MGVGAMERSSLGRCCLRLSLEGVTLRSPVPLPCSSCSVLRLRWHCRTVALQKGQCMTPAVAPNADHRGTFGHGEGISCFGAGCCRQQPPPNRCSNRQQPPRPLLLQLPFRTRCPSGAWQANAPSLAVGDPTGSLSEGLTCSPSSDPSPSPPPPRSRRCRGGDQHKAQEERCLVSGLHYQRPLRHTNDPRGAPNKWTAPPAPGHTESPGLPYHARRELCGPLCSSPHGGHE